MAVSFFPQLKRQDCKNVNPQFRNLSTCCAYPGITYITSAQWRREAGAEGAGRSG